MNETRAMYKVHGTKYLVLFLLLSWMQGGVVRAQINTDRMMDIGRNALYFSDYALSIQYFNRVISAKPHLYEPYYFRGVAKFYLEDYHGAEADCTHAIDINPFFPNTYELRGLARINLGKYEQAEDDYRKATEVQDDNKAAWHNWVLCNIELDSLQRADSISNAIIRKWPKYADGYMMKSQIRLAMKDTLAAEAFIDTALISDRYNVPSLSLKAQLLMKRELWNPADSVLTEAIRLQPKNTRNLINRAMARYHQNNLRGAMEDYDLALDIDPTNFVGHYNRGLLRANVGEDNLAIEDFDFILRIDPNDVMALYNRAELLFETGDYKGAIRDYTELIKTYPNFLQGYIRRAEAKRKMGDIRGAQKDEDHVLREQIAHRYGYASKASRTATTRKKSEIDLDQYQKLVEDDDEETVYESEYRGKIQNKDTDTSMQPPLSLPTYTLASSGARTYFNSGLEHIFVDEYEQAITDFTQAIGLQADLAEAYYNRAYAYAKTKRLQLATEDLTKSIELYPNFAQAYFNRGIVYIFLGENASAIPDLSKAGEMGLFRAYPLMKRYQPTKK